MGKPGQFCCWSPAPELIGCWGERGEVKHLSTCRRRYSVSSGERKRIWLNLTDVKRAGVVGGVLWGRMALSAWERGLGFVLS